MDAVVLQDLPNLLWVPAVHFRLHFAYAVNRLCRWEHPDAVAVELGPETTAAATGWLKELGVAPNSREPLPVMLGLVKSVRKIRRSQRQRAFDLQRRHARGLHEIPSDVLYRELGYSSASVFFLSPTDSILEALRCAIELDVPVYGVDLEDKPYAVRPSAAIEDPLRAAGSLRGYVERNHAAAARGRIGDIDRRREIAMAARLKGILRRHRRVVFTGGIAHFRPLTRLLTSRLVPAVDPVDPVGGSALRHTRIVVDPLLAIQHMDAFPWLTADYEVYRTPASWSSEAKHPLDVASEFQTRLNRAYARLFEETAERTQGTDLDNRLRFEQLLRHLCMLKTLDAPDLYTTLEAARAMLSPSFAKVLAHELMQYPFAVPSGPGVPMLGAVPGPDGEGLRAEYRNGDGRRTSTFFLAVDQGGETARRRVNIPWQWRPEERSLTPVGPEVGEEAWMEDRPKTGIPRTWPPDGALMTLISLRCDQLADTARMQTRSERFEGHIEEGIDVKETIRARALGERNALFVRTKRRSRRTGEPESFGPSPTVFVLETGSAPGFVLSTHPETLEHYAPYVSDTDELERVKRRFGRWVVGGISYGKPTEPCEEMKQAGISTYQLRGVLSLTQACFELVEEARWLELTGYRRSPILHDSSIRGLRDMLRERRGIELDLMDWATTLVRVAVQFAKTHVNVVAAEGFSLLPVVNAEARRRGVAVSRFPLSFFPPDYIRRVAQEHTATPLSNQPGDYSDLTERAMGESSDNFRTLLPRALDLREWRSRG